MCGEVERYLLAAVEQWCGWQEAVCGGELGAGADGLETTHHYLQLTAALCSATRQVSARMEATSGSMQLYSVFMCVHVHYTVHMLCVVGRHTALHVHMHFFKMSLLFLPYSLI